MECASVDDSDSNSNNRGGGGNEEKELKRDEKQLGKEAVA